MNYKIKNLTTDQIKNLKSEWFDFKWIIRVDMWIEDINIWNTHSQEEVLNSLKTWIKIREWITDYA